MKGSNIILFFLFILTQSCVESTSSTGFQFNEEKEISGISALVIDSVSFRYPFRIRQHDSSLYVLDLHGRDFYCSQLSYPNIRLKKSFALLGNGPDDFLSVENIRLNKEGTLYLLDANKEAIGIYKPENDRIYKQIKLSEKLIRSLDFALINDSLFAIPDYTGKCRIQIVDNGGNIRDQLFKIPAKKRKDPNVSDIVLAQAWRSFMDYNPDNGILAMVTQLGQVIEIYNLKTEETINIVYGRFGEPEFATRDAYAIPNGIMGYSDVHVGKDRIYTVFWGTSFEDIRKNPLNRMEGGNTIQVFSLEGTPIIQYTLDRHITGFTIDEKNHRLLGLDVNNEQPIIEYQL